MPLTDLILIPHKKTKRKTKSDKDRIWNEAKDKAFKTLKGTS